MFPTHRGFMSASREVVNSSEFTKSIRGMLRWTRIATLLSASRDSNLTTACRSTFCFAHARLPTLKSNSIPRRNHKQRDRLGLLGKQRWGIWRANAGINSKPCSCGTFPGAPPPVFSSEKISHLSFILTPAASAEQRAYAFNVRYLGRFGACNDATDMH